MQKAVMGLALLVCLGLLQSSLAAHFQDDKYVEQSQYGAAGAGAGARELAGWLVELAQQNERLHKRNSEIINSLLGLPKVLNDAGR